VGFRKTLRTGRVRERKLVRIHAMGLAIRLRRDPELTSRGQSSIVSNEFAATTDGEQRRRDKRFPPSSGRRLANGLYSGFPIGHDILSLCARQRMTVCVVWADDQHLICPMTSVDLH
jgi:hypothetical protein